MLSKRYASINRENCAACGACIKECPRGAISIHKGCYAVVDVQSCVGCGKCAKICPANAILVVSREEA